MHNSTHYTTRAKTMWHTHLRLYYTLPPSSAAVPRGSEQTVEPQVTSSATLTHTLICVYPHWKGHANCILHTFSHSYASCLFDLLIIRYVNDSHLWNNGAWMKKRHLHWGILETWSSPHTVCPASCPANKHNEKEVVKLLYCDFLDQNSLTVLSTNNDYTTTLLNSQICSVRKGVD